METQLPRKRSPTVASAPSSTTPLIRDLQNTIDTFSKLTLSHVNSSKSVDLQAQVNELHQLRQILVDSPRDVSARDAFRRAGGLLIILQNLEGLSGYYNIHGISKEAKLDTLQLIKASFDVLSEAFNEHWGNRNYFKTGIKPDGWKRLEDTLANIGILDGKSHERSSDDGVGRSQLLGYLLAFAVGDDHLSTVFRSLTRALRQQNSGPLKIETDRASLDSLTEQIRSILRGSFTGTIIVQHPEAISILVNLWLPSLRNTDDAEPQARIVNIAVVLTLIELSTVSTHSCWALRESGILSPILRHLFDLDLPQRELDLLKQLARRILWLGIDQDDAALLFREANISSDAAEFLLHAIKVSFTPPHISFDLSLHGYSSLEVSTLGRSFPPQSPSKGYTLTAWIYIETFDKSCHTTIFGAFDTTQTCFVLVYIEKDSHQLILQTSVAAARPSVRFKSVVFDTAIWYHVTIVHHRSKSRGYATLYVNGQRTEQVNCQYPANPPILEVSTESLAVSSPAAATTAPVQAFFGTPLDLAPRLGRGVFKSRWSLGSAHLFDNVLSDEFIIVVQKLGTQYCGNFQDCLGSFMTYRASAELNLHNELLHPGDDKSEITTAIRGKASTIVPESHLLLSFLPTAVFDNRPQSREKSKLVRNLSRLAKKQLDGRSRFSGNGVAINAAVPSIQVALSKARGIAILAAEPIAVTPQALDDVSWRLGGCAALGLGMLQSAKAQQDVVRAVEILFQLIQHNWRNSELMEREDGFAILANLLRQKVQSFPSRASLKPTKGEESGSNNDFVLDLLRLILRFVGYVEEHPQDSVIINPLAYKALLVECNIWRRMSVSTQQLYYGQFMTFVTGTKQHHFNSKRLVRMRIVKHFLHALEEESFDRTSLPAFLEAFLALLKCNPSSDALRSLAMMITYGRQATHRPLKPSRTSRGNSTLSPKTPATPSGSWRSVPLPTYAQVSSLSLELSLAEISIRMLELYAAFLCDDSKNQEIKRFAKTVTNKWLLHLLADDEPRVIAPVMKILARLLNVSGPTYSKKFADQTRGFAILEMRLSKWWRLPSVWKSCFSILFGLDVPVTDVEDQLDVPWLFEAGMHDPKRPIACQEIWPVIAVMLKSGFEALWRNQSEFTNSQDSRGENPLPHVVATMDSEFETGLVSSANGQHRIDSFGVMSALEYGEEERRLMQTITHIFLDLFNHSTTFRDFAASSDFVQSLVFALLAVVAGPSIYIAEDELAARELDSAGQKSHLEIHSSAMVSPPDVSGSRRIPMGRRDSSFVMVPGDKESSRVVDLSVIPVLAPQGEDVPLLAIDDLATEHLVKLVLDIHIYQLFAKKDYTGLGLFLKVPPASQAQQASFQTYMLRRALSEVAMKLRIDESLFEDAKVLTNLAHYTLHMSEAVIEGWFLHGAELLLDFIGCLLEQLQQPYIASLKAVRLCDHAIRTIEKTFIRVSLVQLSQLTELTPASDAVSFLKKMNFWQPILLQQSDLEDHHLGLISVNLYKQVTTSHGSVRRAAADVWRMLLVSKPTQLFTALNKDMSPTQRKWATALMKLVELDNEAFLDWIDDHRRELEAYLIEPLSRKWMDFVAQLNSTTRNSATGRLNKRKERLKHWIADNLQFQKIRSKHELATQIWNSNVVASEIMKHQKSLQDQQEHQKYIEAAFVKMQKKLQGPCGLFEDRTPQASRLDETEGSNRMRLRVILESGATQPKYSSKRKASNLTAMKSLKGYADAPKSAEGASSSEDASMQNEYGGLQARPISGDPDAVSQAQEDEFEIVEEPEDEEYEDKNRKVMRSLERGEHVQQVSNVARIVGLEAFESLMIIGKGFLYLIDDLFQRSDGEIVSVSQAPQEERDPYLQMISGRDTQAMRNPSGNAGIGTRRWTWAEVASISKRRFLFRDVAIEIFFSDGRSYLLTSKTPDIRDELFSLLVARAPQVAEQQLPYSGDPAWTAEAFGGAIETPKAFGSRLAKVFNPASAHPATKRWAKREMSNFNYLMLVNTMAGRTFNDLTQYPVFPWVLADYTSEELDLTNPRSFRDLTKPMGCQTPSREADFRSRYMTFAEMGDQDAPPFHYGTHYSSAMIVTSYLIRLQPFVQSYLLLQGGTFDHADRLFYSLAKAWDSASRDNMSDVRELIPEFFYLPEFLTNLNKYDFGSKQGTGEPINDVILPPWAKGDPNIFIAKHREALESRYVSERLHHWIDLVFGIKQSGEAAVETTNVFHYLSYHGAKDLDKIVDPMERMATIGIIHNFGQTPHQVFSRAHPSRQNSTRDVMKLDRAAESLTRVPATICEVKERVTSLLYTPKHERVLCSTAFRHYIPPTYEKYLEWGFADNSIRFFTSDKRKLLNIYENLHQSQISAVTFASSALLLTAGEDSVVQAFAVHATAKSVELQFKASLFGHRQPVTFLAASRAWSTFMSADDSGRILLWDMNSLTALRAWEVGVSVDCARINNITGNMMLCCGQRVLLYTLNGHLLLEQNVCDREDDQITACAFYEGTGSEWIERDLILTGHRQGVANIWNKTVSSDGKWLLKLVRRLDDRAQEDGGNYIEAITQILPIVNKVFTGDEGGRVYEWNMVQRQHGKGASRW